MKRSPRRAIETFRAVSICRRLASTGPVRLASRALSTGRKTTSSAGALRRSLNARPPSSCRRALHLRLQRFGERIQALPQVGTVLLRLAALGEGRTDLTLHLDRVLAKQRARVGRR